MQVIEISHRGHENRTKLPTLLFFWSKNYCKMYLRVFHYTYQRYYLIIVFRNTVMV